MKKKYFLFLLFTFISFISYSQKCTTTWPYLYPEFQKGTVYTVGGQKFDRSLNIHVLNSTLHYLDGDIIKETKSSEVLLVEIGNDKFMAVEGRIMKVIGSNEKGFVATLTHGDIDKLNETGGAYGSSSTSIATMKLTSVEAGNKSITNHMELRQQRDMGKSIDLKNEYYIVTSGKVYRATKYSIEETLDNAQKAKFKSFLKTTKIKWKEPESLMKLMAFFNNK